MQSNILPSVILITGASSGIGKALAIHYLQQGCCVAVCGRDAGKLERLQEAYPSEKLLTYVADISQETESRNFVQAAADKFGRIDVLINNAGISMRALFEDLDLSVLHQLMNINFWGAVYCSKYALPWILQTKGTIAGISSVAGYKGLPCRTGYSASKFALQGFLESLRIEMIPKEVNVLWVSPGFVSSNIRNTALGARGKAQAETPLNESRLMSAETCAAAIARAIEKRKRSVLMDNQGRWTVWLNRLFPHWVDRMVYRHFAKEPGSPLTEKI